MLDEELLSYFELSAVDSRQLDWRPIKLQWHEEKKSHRKTPLRYFLFDVAALISPESNSSSRTGLRGLNHLGESCFAFPQRWVQSLF